jgi:hypothetical protein
MSNYNVTRTVSSYPLYDLKVERVSKSNAEKEADHSAWEVYQVQLAKQKDKAGD